MVRRDEIRPAEVAMPLLPPATAGLVFIDRIRTPWTDRLACPRQGRRDGPLCRIEVFAPWAEGLDGLAQYDSVEVLYWLDRSRRDLVRQSPKTDGTPLLDLKPDRCAFTPLAPPQPGDDEVG